MAPSTSLQALSSYASNQTAPTGSTSSVDRSLRENPHDERYQGLRASGAGAGTLDPKLLEQIDLSEKARTEFLENELKNNGGLNALKESHTTKLTQILEEPALRSLFREFLRSNFCEENLVGLAPVLGLAVMPHLFASSSIVSLCN